MPKIDLFASKLSHQLPQYFAWKLTTADLGQSIPLWIFPILPYFKRLEESELRPSRKSVACHTYLAVSNWYSLLLEMSIFRPLLLPSNTSLKTHKGKFTF